MLGLVLSTLGHKVKVVYDPLTVLDAAREFRPEVIFSDISMPGLNGYDLARALRASGDMEGVYLVAITGHGQTSDKEAALAAGFDQHLTKPADMRALKELFASLAMARQPVG
jgi:CheY-like chemotaxis protein